MTNAKPESKQPGPYAWYVLALLSLTYVFNFIDRQILAMLMEPIIKDLPFKAGDRVLLFVNGMGGTPLIELYIVYRKAVEILAANGITVARNLIGPYITSLEMAGASITVLKLDDDLLSLWDAPVKTPGMRWGV